MTSIVTVDGEPDPVAQHVFDQVRAIVTTITSLENAGAIGEAVLIYLCVATVAWHLFIQGFPRRRRRARFKATLPAPIPNHSKRKRPVKRP